MIDSPIDEIKNRLDIVDVISGYMKLQKAGRNYRANCPFHSEKTPSFMVSPEKQMWHCFGCGKGGSIFDFVMEMEGVEFGDALRILAQKAGVELKPRDAKFSAEWKTEKSRLYEICALTNRFFVKQLEESKTGKEMLDYLIGRGLKQNTIKDWQIGYAPGGWQSLFDFLAGCGYSDDEILKTGLSVKNEKAGIRQKFYDRFRDRIIFPISDINGSIVGFTGRENPKNPDSRMGKYVNTPNTLIYNKSNVLYGLDKAKMNIRKDNLCILVEGQTDVIMSHQAGFKNVIASSGTALTEQQLKIIKRYTENLATAFDMDAAGEIATKRGIDLALQFGFNAKVIVLPQNQDPADCIRENPKIWAKAIARAEGLVEFYFNGVFSNNNPETVEGKKKISEALLPAIKKISNKVEQAHWLQELATRLKVQEQVLIEEMDKIKDDYSNYPSAAANEKDYQNKINANLSSSEEYTIGLILAYPENFKKHKNEPSYLFTNSDLRQIFEILKKNAFEKTDLKKSKNNLPANLAEKADYLAFVVEAQKDMLEDFNPKKEMRFCFGQLGKYYLKKERNKLALAIKDAENKKDESLLKKLTEKFNKLSL
ncbi:MAG: DNA primase [Patescibacteria group bacterium]|nr:DNA primase [Patescibacteria group bacterium]